VNYAESAGPIRSRTFWTGLVAQAGALVGIGMLVSGAVATVFARRQTAQFEQEIDRRGSSLLQTLERHQDLRLAISLHDGRAAQSVVEDVLASNPDMAYLGVLDAEGKPFAWTRRGRGAEHQTAMELKHHVLDRTNAAESNGTLRRFTRQVVSAESEGGLLGLPGSATGPQTLGFLVMAIGADRVGGAVARQTFITVAATGAFLLAAFLGFFLLLSRRLGRMVSFAERLANGDLAADLSVSAGDEVGRLARALVSLRDSLLAAVREMKDASNALESTSSEVLRGTNQQLQRTQTQVESVAHTERSVDGLRQRFQRAHAAAESVLELAGRSEQSSRSGRDAVQQALAQMSELGQQVEQTSRVLAELVDRTSHIARIIDAVRDLSAQSKMVALNAAIVASRAGTAGTGFAVVATEIRALADRSQRATAEVQNILEEIQRAASATTTVADESRRRAEGGLVVARTAGEAIQQLSEVIQRSSRAATEIAGSTQEQGAAVDGISRSVADISRAAEEVAAGIGQLEQASRAIRDHSTRMRALVERYSTPAGPVAGAAKVALALALLSAGAARGEVVMFAQRDVPQYAQVAAAFQKVNPQARVADVGDGALAVRDSDIIVAIGSKAFDLARAAPGSAAIVAAAVLNPQSGGRHPIAAVPMESRSADALDALRALAPDARKVLALHPPGESPILAEARAAAKARGLSVEFRSLGDLSGLEASLREALQGQQAVWLLPDPRLARPEVAKFLVATCLDRKLPLIGFLAGMAQVGALVAVAADFDAIGREAARLASDLAARPPAARSGLPFRFVAGHILVNSRTAEQLGLSGAPPAGAEMIR
jgi:methyl-accepting chemotaxis protein